MRRIGFVLALGLFVALGWTGQARAQAEHYANRPWELNLHAGGLAIDDADTELILGGRIVLNQASGWGFGGNFDWVQQSEDDFEINTYLYSAEVDYTFGSPSQLHPFVGVGVGAATSKPDEDLEALGFESDTEFLLSPAAGVKWFNRTNDPNWAIRADLRDHIVFEGDEEIEGVEFEGETTHNFEFSGGISFLFGG